MKFREGRKRMAPLTSLGMLTFALVMCYLAVANYATSAQGDFEVTKANIVTHFNAYISALLTGTMVAFLIHSKEVGNDTFNPLVSSEAASRLLHVHHSNRYDTRSRFYCTVLW